MKKVRKQLKKVKKVSKVDRITYPFLCKVPTKCHKYRHVMRPPCTAQPLTLGAYIAYGLGAGAYLYSRLWACPARGQGGWAMVAKTQQKVMGQHCLNTLQCLNTLVAKVSVCLTQGIVR